MFGAINDRGPVSYAESMFAKKPMYTRLLAEESYENMPVDRSTGMQKHSSPRVASILGYCLRALILSFAVYAAVTLALRHSDCTVPTTLKANAFIPAYLRREPQFLVQWDDYPEFNGYTTSADDAWDELMPSGGGYIVVSNPKQYGLGRGKDVSDADDPIYAISAFHQIHCLGVIREVISAIEIDSASINFTTKMTHYPPLGHHLNHCIQYLRQSIMCAADPTVESLTEEVQQDGSVRIMDLGWGNTHVCRSWNLLKDYAAAHAHSRSTGLGAKQYVEAAIRRS